MWHEYTDQITGRQAWRYVCPGDRVVILRGSAIDTAGTVVTIRGDGRAVVALDGMHPHFPMAFPADYYEAPESTVTVVSPFTRNMRKSPQWRNVKRDGRTVTAERVCTDCGAPIPTDAILREHWSGRHDPAVLA